MMMMMMMIIIMNMIMDDDAFCIHNIIMIVFHVTSRIHHVSHYNSHS